MLKRIRRIYVIVLAVAGIAVLSLVFVKLADFQKDYEINLLIEEQKALEEKNRKDYETACKKAPEIFVTDWLKNLSKEEIASYWLLERPNNYSSTESVINNVSSRFSEDLTIYREEGFTDEKPVYVVCDKDGQRLMKVSLKGENLDWQAENVSVLIKEGNEEMMIIAPADIVVKIGDKELDSFTVTETKAQFVPEKIYKEQVNSVLANIYVVKNLFEKTQPSFLSVGERSYDFVSDFEVAYTPLEAEINISEVKNKAKNFVDAYVNFYVSGSRNTRDNRNKVLSFLKYGTPAYSSVVQSEDGVSWNNAYDNIEIISDSVEEIKVFCVSDNMVCADVNYIAKVDLNNERIVYGEGCFRVYVMCEGIGRNLTITSFETL